MAEDYRAGFDVRPHRGHLPVSLEDRLRHSGLPLVQGASLVSVEPNREGRSGNALGNAPALVSIPELLLLAGLLARGHRVRIASHRAATHPLRHGANVDVDRGSGHSL